MSQYYSPGRSRNLYNGNDKKAFKLSRSKIDGYLKCQKCFYIDRKLGVDKPSPFPYSLNSAVDHLLKEEFDSHRLSGKPHPLIEKYGIDAKPIPHDDLDKWRTNFTGVQYLHTPTNLLVFGAIDDLWQNSKGEYIVVDYKSTSKDEEITVLDKDWQDGYKRQMEVYQWLLKQNGYKVSNTGYFVYCNGKKNKKAFDGILEFDITLIPYKGSDKWVENTIFDIKKCLESNSIPDSSDDCDYCNYRNAVDKVLRMHKF